MKKIMAVVVMAFITVALQAQFSKATLQASGLTCAMCSKAVKVALENVPFVQEVKVNIKSQEYIITFKENNNADFDALKKAVEDAGIQKDVVISGKITRDPKPDRVAIYGWHKLDGNPIQPLYTGHIYWWVDYSQGIRLVYRKIKVEKKWMDYTEVLNDPVLKKILCDEEWCDFYRYNY